MDFDSLEQYRRWIWNCQSCSTCQKGPQNVFSPAGPTPDRICPSYDQYRRLTYSAQGRILAARAFLEGTLEVTDSFVKSFYECTLCGSCGPERMGRSSCSVHRQQVPIFRALRSDLVKMGKGPTEPYKRVAASLKKSGNRFGAARTKRTRWIPGELKLPEKAEAVFFPGCVASFKAIDLAQSSARLLHHAGIEFAVLGEEEKCCGNPLSASGQQEAFETFVKHNVAAIRRAGASKVMTSCACCYDVLRFRYPEVVGALDFEVLHTTEVLARALDQGKLKVEKSLSGTFTYQDPCHLTRVNAPEVSLFEEPRKLLQSIPGISFVEMEGNGMFTQCCGRQPFELPELSLHTGINRIRDARAAGAGTVVTSCSFCDWSLSNAARNLDIGVNVMDITSLLARAAGLSPTPRAP